MNRALLRIIFLFIALSCGMQIHAQENAPDSLLKKARVFIRKSNPDSAVILADSVLNLTKGQTSYEIRALGIKANALTYLHQTKDAIALYFDALRLCKKPGDNAQIAFISNELGYLYYNQQDYAAAKKYFKQELDARREMKDEKRYGHQLINLASIHRLLNEYDSAKILLDDVRKILSAKTDTVLEGSYYHEHGTFFQATGQIDSARKYYTKCEMLWKAARNQQQLLRVLYNLGELELAQKNYPAALTAYLQSDSLAILGNHLNEQVVIEAGIAKAYAATGDHEKAFLFRDRSARMADSLDKTGDDETIALLERQFQAEKSKETIRTQQLELQKERSRLLLIIVISVVLLFALTLAILFFSFRRRVRKQVDAAREKFFSNVVHEIRTPLSMIGAPVSLLQKKITDPESLKQLQLAERNINRLNELINQMLDISKLDATKYALKESYGQPVEFLGELVLPFATRAGEKGLKFSVQNELPEEQVFFDRDALEKITGNLLDNAIKYTPAGGSAGIDLSGGGDEKNYTLVMQVWDTGTGISKADKENIFRRFYRSEEHQRSGTKGVGIGLALVNELVKLMNGTIELESEPGKGAVFTVRLVFRKREEASANAVAANGNCILLVEDDKDILSFNSQLLAGEGFHVLEAGNGDEAQAILKEQLPELIITDLMMPGKDGLTLLKEVRADLATEHIPVIILSAKTAVPSRLEGMREGAQVYLPKPFIPDELLALVNNQLNILAKHRDRYREKIKEAEPTIEERYAGTDPFTKKFYEFVVKHLDNSELSVEQLAEMMHINRSHFQRKMKTLTSYSPSELLRIIRLEKARELLLDKKGNVTEVAYLTGFTSQSYFSKCFVQQFGFSPSATGKS